MRLGQLNAATLIALLAALPATAQTPIQKPTQLPTVQRPAPAIPAQPRVVAPKPAPLDLPSDDIMAAAHLVMMEASKSAREDLRAMMANVKAANAAKPGTRSGPPAAPCAGQTTADWRACLLAIETKLAKLPADPARAALIRSIRDKLDSMSDLNQKDQVQLQKMMDQKAQLEQMISDLMKRLDDTSNAMVANIK